MTIGNSVTSIGWGVFENCTRLISVTIPNSVTNLGVAFSGCTSLSAIRVEPLNSFYSSVDGVLFDKSETRLIQYPGGKAGSYAISNGVTSIGWGAFNGCTNLTSVTIPNSVTSIDSAFSGCSSLNGVYFTGNAPTFGWNMFSGDDNATVYYLPGTTGWDATFGGRPTAMWKPQVQTSGGSFGVWTNQFGFTITWASGMVIVVEACTNLANSTWFPLQTNTLTGDSFYFSDPQWTNYPALFYRLRSP